jgi:hypothetical protein
MQAYHQLTIALVLAEQRVRRTLTAYQLDELV